MQRKPRVLIVQRRMAHYRLPFFRALRSEMASRSIELMVASGTDTAEEVTKGDSGVLEWATPLPTKYFLKGRICWQPFGNLLRQCDLVVVTHENKLIYNVVAQCLRLDVKVGLWGHGANLQGNAMSLRERYKRQIAKQADWWFAYTDMSRVLVEKAGFPSDRICVLNNAVDTVEMLDFRAGVTEHTLESTRTELELNGARIGIFVGSLYTDKRLQFLFDAAQEIKRRVEDFELIIVGSGPQESLVRSFCAGKTWVRYLGVCKGRDKVNLMALSRIMLNPGLVGLGLLDSFVCGVPMVTTDCGLHSPEISYLESGVNGVMTRNSHSEFVDAAVQLLTDDDQLEKLRVGCRESAGKYTIKNMVDAFADGVDACLRRPGLR